MYKNVACMCTTYVSGAHRSEEGIGVPGIAVTSGCEPPCGSWKPNPGLLQEQQIFLTSKPSLHPL